MQWQSFAKQLQHSLLLLSNDAMHSTRVPTLHSCASAAGCAPLALSRSARPLMACCRLGAYPLGAAGRPGAWSTAMPATGQAR